ncbi:MAG: tRNA (adenosine(37)-N6)-threonylcarbamoyltransferase complex ATPase subunit type 1 TsaE [Candidatus Pacebacteria bacterium]|nr:tRNA (adenosine(37)-N6)-threonylcarbamoyltransferase complex ATPase subunit type 1 TsaE [Candidatus Paceibacterota bacterium]
MGKIYSTKSPSETKKLGRNLAKKILGSGFQRKARILCLKGGLGGGKTTFLQGFAKGLGISEKILSPTFVIMKRFSVPAGKSRVKRKNFENFYHIDCYRIESPKDILALEFKKIINYPQNIIAIEWAEKIKKILPKDAINIGFEFISSKKRKIKINGRTKR